MSLRGSAFSKPVFFGLALLCAAYPKHATAELFSDLLECAAVFDVLDVSQMEDPEAFRAELDTAATLFVDTFQTFHGVTLTNRLRAQYREAWQVRPPTRETAEALANKLKFCEREAELRGVAVGVTERRLLRLE